MKLNKILLFEPKVNVQMLLFLFLNAIAFDSLYWIVDEIVDSGEITLLKLIVYAIVFIGSLTAFKLEFKRLNQRNKIFELDDLDVAYPGRNWNKKID